MLNQLRIVLFVGLAAFSIPQIAAAAAGDFRVLHHQAVKIQSQPQVGAAERVTFDAYGRRFELALMPNERIRRAMNPDHTATVPLEGTVEGATKSWVRMTRSPSGWRGMIYDGQNLYAVEPASDIAGATVEPLTVSGSSPVVYRLDDAVLPPEQMSCEVVQPDGASTTASAAFDELSRELHAEPATSELTASKQVRVGIVGDFEFVNQFASGTTTVED